MINVLFCGNEYVFDGILTCSLSILKRTTTNEPFTFYVYTMDVSHLKDNFTPISDDLIIYLDMIVKKYNSSNRVIKIDVTEIYIREFAGCVNEESKYSPYAFLRLFADIVPDMPDKILYLDVDIMFNRDICELYGISVEGYEYAAARDHYGKYLINPNYINSGVLLLNIKKIKETGLLVNARRILKTKKLLFPDQTAIRKSTTKKKLLRQKFNDQKFLHKHTVVRHFSKRLFYLPYPHVDNIKQWHVSRIHKIFKYYEFDDVLYEYIYYKKNYEYKLKENK